MSLDKNDIYFALSGILAAPLGVIYYLMNLKFGFYFDPKLPSTIIFAIIFAILLGIGIFFTNKVRKHVKEQIDNNKLTGWAYINFLGMPILALFINLVAFFIVLSYFPRALENQANSSQQSGGRRRR